VSTPWPGAPYRHPAVGPFPAGLDAHELPRVPRPPLLVLALVLQLFSGLPFVIVGAVVLNGVDGLAPEDTGMVGGVLLVAGLAFCGLAVTAFVGLNWARMLLGVLTGPVAIVLLVTLVNGAIGMTGGQTVVAMIMLAAVTGGVLMFLPASAEFFANPRGAPAPPAPLRRL
jgi:hypothetical protein